MTPESLDRIERELSVVLPQAVRDALQDRPVFEAVRRDLLDAPPIGHGIITYEAAVNAFERSAITHTRLARRKVQWCGWDNIPQGGPAEWLAALKPWRHEWLWLGEDFSGDVWFLELDGEPVSIDLWEHDGRFSRVVFKSFADFADWAKQRAPGGPGT